MSARRFFTAVGVSLFAALCATGGVVQAGADPTGGDPPPTQGADEEPATTTPPPDPPPATDAPAPEPTPPDPTLPEPTLPEPTPTVPEEERAWLLQSAFTLPATTASTDSVPELEVSGHEGQKGDGTFTSGNVTGYSEGDSINFRFELHAEGGPASGDLEVRFTGDDGPCVFFEGSFVPGALENLGGPQPTVTVQSGPSTSGGEWVVVLHVDYAAEFDVDSTSRFNYTLTLSDEAGNCNGSSQGTTLDPGEGFKNSGGKKVPVPANALIAPNTASFTVHKDFSDDNTDPVSMALACTDGTVTTTPLDASDEAVGGTPAVFEVTGFDTEAGTTCTATEVVPTGYTSSGTCSATLAVGACTIINTLNTAQFTVHKDFSDNNDDPVSMALECNNGATVTNSPQNASDEGVGGTPAVFTVTGFDVPVEVSAFVAPDEITCTATEDVPTGYTSSGTCSATLAVGECTITNTLNTAPFTVHKDFSDNNPASVSMALACTDGTVTNTPQDATDEEVVEGAPAVFDVTGFDTAAGTTCTATEVVPTGYTPDGSPAGTCSATLADGGCTITNTLNTAEFTVHKDFSDDNDDPASMALECGAASVTTTPLDATDEANDGGLPAVFTVTGFDTEAGTTCTATETVPTGYTASGGGTCSATLAEGGCTITNTLNEAEFTVHKDFSDNNPAAVSMALSCDDGTVTNTPQDATDEEVVEGAPAVFDVTGFDTEAGTTCTATEDTPAGYRPDGEPGGTCAATLADGECTITNTLRTASFTVHKDFSDDNDDPVSMALECDDGSVTDTPLDATDEEVVEGAPAVFNVTGFDTRAGTTCTATETVPSGYTGSDGGTCSATLEAGECTITNTLNEAEFTVHKDFSDNNPAAVSIALECDNEATVTNSPQDATDEDVEEGAPAVFTVTGFDIPDVSTFAVPDEITCTATETVPSGYTGSDGGTCSATLEAGECTITNTLNEAEFTVHKDFSDNNPAAVSIALECDNEATVTNSPQDATDEDVEEGAPAVFTVTGFDIPDVSTFAVPDEITCTATETVPSGYTGSDGGTCSATLEAGECTITNTLNEAEFTVHKDFSDNNPAAVSIALECDNEATVTNSPQDATDEDVEEGAPAVFTVTGFDFPSEVSAFAVPAEITCTATEVVPDGYTPDGSPAGTCSAILAVGECTITNTLNTAPFTVHKDFSDDNPDPVSMSLECDDGTVTNTPQDATDEAVVEGAPAVFTVTGFDTEVATTCTATEVVPTGYTASDGGTCSATLEAGECTITNTLNEAEFTVHKDFDDDNADPVSVALVCDNGATVTNSPQNASDEGVGGTPAVFTVTGFDIPDVSVEVSAFAVPDEITCTATEDVPTGYTSSGTCSATLAVGECTITNTLNTATFTVHKDFSDDNPAAVSMALSCDDGTVTNTPQDATDEDVAEGTPAVFTVTGFDTDAATTCTATEDVPTGYTSSGTCSATLAVGECTITNTLNEAEFTVHKDFSDDNTDPVSVALVCDNEATVTNSPQNASDEGVGGTPAVFTVTGFDIPDVSTFAVPDEITCTATEDVPTGYTSSGTCSATLAVGECTITNTLNEAEFTVHKDFSDDNTDPVSVALVCDNEATVTDSPQNASDEGVGGTPAVFTVTGFDIPDVSVEVSAFAVPDEITCTATEDVPTGYTSSGTCSATLAVGDCTITNTLNEAEFTVHKDFSDDDTAAVSMALECDNGATVTDSPQNASDEGVGGAPAVFTVTGFDIPIDVSAFAVPAEITCTATEGVPAGYTTSGPCSATLAVGECTITNTLIPPPPPPPPPPEPPPPPPPPPPPIEPVPSTPVVPPIVEPVVEPVVVAAPDVPEGLSLIRNQIRRAFVPGQPVRLEGTAPAGCDPMLQVDGDVVGPVDTDRAGRFTLDVDTSDLGSGEHLAEIVCTDGTILETGFWVASPQTSSNTLSVVLVALLMLVALGWVSARGLVSTTSPER